MTECTRVRARQRLFFLDKGVESDASKETHTRAGIIRWTVNRTKPHFLEARPNTAFFLGLHTPLFLNSRLLSATPTIIMNLGRACTRTWTANTHCSARAPLSPFASHFHAARFASRLLSTKASHLVPTFNRASASSLLLQTHAQSRRYLQKNAFEVSKTMDMGSYLP